MTASVQFYALAYSGEDEQPLDATSDERAPRELTADDKRFLASWEKFERIMARRNPEMLGQYECEMEALTDEEVEVYRTTRLR
jgi:hypothetical protein